MENKREGDYNHIGKAKGRRADRSTHEEHHEGSSQEHIRRLKRCLSTVFHREPRSEERNSLASVDCAGMMVWIEFVSC